LLNIEYGGSKLIHDFGFGRYTFLAHWINSRVSNYEEPLKKKEKSEHQGLSEEEYEVSVVKALTNFPLKSITNLLKINRYNFYSRLSNSDEDFKELIRKHREDFIYNFILSLKDIRMSQEVLSGFQQGPYTGKESKSSSAHEKKLITEATKIFCGFMLL
jgi:hypothetical protein